MGSSMTFVQIGRRETVNAPRIEEVDESAYEEQGIIIKAEISDDEQRCTFTASQAVLEGYGWWYHNPDAASGSPLAEKLLAVEDIESCLIADHAVTVVRTPLCFDEWEPTAREIGTRIRTHLLSDEEPVSQELMESIPSENEVRYAVNRVIDEVLNPGVASHGGEISLVEVKGNNIWVHMGGGCQGCSSAAVTLRQGVEGELRKKVPFLGAINDATDHSAGANPYLQ